MEPLFLDSPMHEKIWGGNRLKTEFGYDIPSEHTGEYWAISAHPNGVSYVKNGKYAGFHLAELYKDKPELFGNPKTSVFPLLTKILDANDWLSVQVHPDDAYGLEHEGELGKTECWYIIDAEEGAEIIYGHKQVIGTDFCRKLLLKKVTFSLYQVVPCMLLVQVS